MTEIKRQENVIIVASRVEHYAIRKRDWTAISASLVVCRPASSWMEPAGWATLGAAASGLFTIIGLFATDTLTSVRIFASTATVAALVVGLILLRASGDAKRTAQDRVDRLKTQMDEIAAECDMEGSLQ